MIHVIRYIRCVLLAFCLLPGCSCRENQAAKLHDFINSARNEFLEPFEQYKYESFAYSTPNERTYVLLYRVVKLQDGTLRYPLVVRLYPGYTGPLGGVEGHPGISRLCDPCFNQPYDMIVPLSEKIERHLYFIQGEGERGSTLDAKAAWYVHEVPAPITGPVTIPNISALPLLSGYPEYQTLLDKLDEATKRLEYSQESHR